MEKLRLRFTSGNNVPVTRAHITLDEYETLRARVAELDAGSEVHQSIAQIGELIRTQDNRITDQPIFIVERQRTEWGFSTEYSDEYKWLNPENDYEEADEEFAAELDEAEGMIGWEKVYYKHYWEFVTACFTEQGCKDYLSRNGHNLGKTRIFACGSYRNDEWQIVRKFLMSYTTPQPVRVPDEAKIYSNHILEVREWREGWNACRKAMLAAQDDSK